MDEDTVEAFIMAELDGVDVARDGGNRFYFFDPGEDLPKEQRFPFATLVASDAYDGFSDLSREGVFRLNIGLDKARFTALFGEHAAEEPDYAALDTLMPHPVYGKMHWVCVLNPAEDTFEEIKPLLAAAHAAARAMHLRRIK